MTAIVDKQMAQHARGFNPLQMVTMVRLLLLVTFALAPCVHAYAQSEAEIQARIKYQKAKIALERKQYQAALEAFEDVQSILGPNAKLQYNIAQAAFGAGDYEKAGQYVNKVLRTEDEDFKKTVEYEEAYRLAAEIELAAEAKRRSDEAERLRIEENERKEQARKQEEERIELERKRKENMCQQVTRETDEINSDFRECKNDCLSDLKDCKRSAASITDSCFVQACVDARFRASDECVREDRECVDECASVRKDDLGPMQGKIRECRNY